MHLVCVFICSRRIGWMTFWGGGVCFVVVYSDCVMCCDAVNIVWLNRNVLRSRMFSVSLTGGSMVCIVIIVCYLYNLGTWAVKIRIIHIKSF